VDHFAVLGLYFRYRNLPLRGGSSLEHHPRGRAAAAHRHEEVTRRARTVGVLIAVACLVARRLNHSNLAPVCFELVGDDDRNAGANALPHLGAMADDADRAIVGDRDKDQRTVAPAIRHPVRAVLRRVGRTRRRGDPGRQHEATERERLVEKPTAADVDDMDRVSALGMRNVPRIEW